MDSVANEKEKSDSECDKIFEEINEHEQIVVVSDSNNHSQINRYSNGLIQDTNYFRKSKSCKIINGHYSYEKSPTAIKVIFLSSDQYMTVFDNGWFNGCVIDSYIIKIITKCNNVSYIPTDDTL